MYRVFWRFTGVLKGLFQAEVLQNIAKPRCGGLSVWGVRVKDGGHRAKFCGPELDQLHQLFWSTILEYFFVGPGP